MVTEAREIIEHYKLRGFRHFELRKALIRHARLLRVNDPLVAEELIERARKPRL